MLEKLGIHTILIVGGTRKVMHNTQRRRQKESNLIAIYISYIVEKWDHNKKGNYNIPQDNKNHHNSLSFLII